MTATSGTNRSSSPVTALSANDTTITPPAPATTTNATRRRSTVWRIPERTGRSQIVLNASWSAIDEQRGGQEQRGRAEHAESGERAGAVQQLGERRGHRVGVHVEQRRQLLGQIRLDVAPARSPARRPPAHTASSGTMANRP